jgi:hypothetical protein
MLQIVASLIDTARGIIYDRHMFIVQATDLIAETLDSVYNLKNWAIYWIKWHQISNPKINRAFFILKSLQQHTDTG